MFRFIIIHWGYDLVNIATVYARIVNKKSFHVGRDLIISQNKSSQISCHTHGITSFPNFSVSSSTAICRRSLIYIYFFQSTSDLFLLGVVGHLWFLELSNMYITEAWCTGEKHNLIYMCYIIRLIGDPKYIRYTRSL